MKTKRLITHLAWAFVLFAGFSTIACSPPVKRAAKKSCKAAKECSPAGFNAVYDSVKDCTDGWKEDEKELVAEYGQKCVNAMAKVLICYSKELIKDCNVTDLTVASECADDVSTAVEKCPDDAFLSYGYDSFY